MGTLFGAEEISRIHDVSIREEGRKEGHKEGRIEGRKEGRIEGRKEGQNSLALLMQKLFELGRDTDAKLAAADEEERERLFKEFHLA